MRRAGMFMRYRNMFYATRSIKMFKVNKTRTELPHVCPVPYGRHAIRKQFKRLDVETNYGNL